jgi:4-diphosphocytidyl-2-C-methyl-D-erythritol kinase
MYLQRSGSEVQVWTPAKLNLVLEVLGKRMDGFHELVTLMTAVRIFDTLWLVPDEGGRLELTCSWDASVSVSQDASRAGGHESAMGDLPEGTDNIVLRAVQSLRDRAGGTWGARLRLLKRIPSAAGLGGASSDAAAALVAANSAWRLGWSPEQLADVAAELGSDVPFFLGPPAAVCRGRGELVEPVDGLGKLHFVVVRPPGGLSTPEVYRHCRPAPEDPPLGALLDAVRRGDLQRVGQMLVNRLQEPAESLSPWVRTLRREFAKTACVAHQMTGSGTAYFGICRHARHARQVAGRLQARKVGRVWCTENVVA